MESVATMSRKISFFVRVSPSKGTVYCVSMTSVSSPTFGTTDGDREHVAKSDVPGDP